MRKDDPIPAAWREQLGRFFQVPPEALELERVAPRSDVWCVRIGGVPRAALKQLPAPHAEDEVPPVEATAAILQRTSPPAVPYLAHFPEHRLLLTVWVGEATLNVLLQEAPQQRERWGNLLVSHFVALERRFREARETLIPFAYPMDYPRYLRETLDSPLEIAHQVFGVSEACIAFLEQQISTIPPTLGPLDCNAQNVCVDEKGVWFLDLTRIGWDWPERRLVQYAFTLGPSGGRPCLALTSSNVTRYAREMGQSRQIDPIRLQIGVDAHAFLATLVVLARVRWLLERPQEVEPSLRESWDAPEERLEALKAILAQPLSQAPLICTARASVASRM